MALSWDEMYKKAVEYYEEHGNLLIPQSFICDDGTNLGKWLNTQRAVKNGIRPGTMNEYREGLLNSIGMDWNPNMTAWNIAYSELEQFYKEKGHINVPLRFITKSNFKLGLWLQNQRRSYLKKGRGALNQEQIKKLEALNIIWEPNQFQWMQNYSILEKYYKEHGNIDVPRGYCVDGVDLSRWLDYQRSTYNGVGAGVINETQIELLEKLGIHWDNKLDLHWDEMFMCAKGFFEKYGHLNTLFNYVAPNGEKLGSWIFTQRQNWKNNKLDPKRKDLLDTIGMNWEYTSQKQTSFFEQAIVYYFSKIYPDTKSRDKQFGIELDVYIPSQKIAIEYDGQVFHSAKKVDSDEQKNKRCQKLGISLYRIREKDCASMKNESQNIYLEENNIPSFENALYQLLKMLNIDTPIDININRDCGEIYSQYLMLGPALCEDDSVNYIISTEWMSYYNLAKQYFEQHGHLLVGQNEEYCGIDLGNWIALQRKYYNSDNTQFASQKVALLEQIGMVWDVFDYKWELGFYYAEQYYKAHGDLLIPSNYVINNFYLGHWIANQRNKKKGKYATSGKITAAQINRLNSIGMAWNALDVKWYKMFHLAEEYYKIYGNLEIPHKYKVNEENLGQWIAQQRSNYKKGSNPNFTNEKIQMLERIGMKWEIGAGNARPHSLIEKWETMYLIAQSEIEKNPNIKFTKRYKTSDGVQLGSWIYRQNQIYNGKASGVLECWQIEKLKALGLIK